MISENMNTNHGCWSSLCRHMGLRQLQDCKDRRCQKHNENPEILVGFLQDYTGGRHPFFDHLQSISHGDTRNCSQILEAMPLLKYMQQI